MLDMGLPLMSGEDFADRLRAEQAEPPSIVVMTAAGTIVDKATRVGAAAYVAKPFDLDDLVQTVRETLEASAHRR
jgi:DNA-binding response OmpR family regulator